MKQLQSLYDRIPQRGPATNVILTLLDICRTAQAQNVSGALTLKPPQAYEQGKKLNVCNGNSNGIGVDKETNTSIENLVWQQLNDDNGNGRFKISDKCDNNNHFNVDDKSNHRSKCCDANNKTTTTTMMTMNCSTNSINFDNLKLQCMCSSDNNSLDEFHVENCDNCCTTNPKTSPKHHQCQSNQSASFRERLLNFTGSNARADDVRVNNLKKRNSELVLGTNFENTPISGGVYKACQSYRISCDNIFSDKTTATTASIATNERHNNTSNHSLSTESEHRTQIPYSYLERPTMKLSQSEDRNLRELKIALSSTLPLANKSNNSNVNKVQIIGNLKSSQIVTQQPQSCTSSSSTSSKFDKISFSLSTSSTSDAILASIRKPHHQQNNMTKVDMRVMEDDSDKQQEDETIYNECENNEKITEPLELGVDDKSASSMSVVNNISINNSNNGNGKKRRTPESKLAIDLNDRSKYTEEVSV